MEPQGDIKLFLHTHFDIHYNGNRVIEINVATDPTRVADLTHSDGAKTVSYSYSVKWKETTKSFAKSTTAFASARTSEAILRASKLR